MTNLINQSNLPTEEVSLQHDIEHGTPLKESDMKDLINIINEQQILKADQECQDNLQKLGVDGCLEYLSKKQNEWESIPLNIAIIGNSGVGKSSFINAIRGLSNEDAESADIGVIEITMGVKSYKHPDNKNLVFWDLPGVGTVNFPKENYLKKIHFSIYDFFMVLSANRFTENDGWLAQEVVANKKNLFFIRTKIDAEIDKDKKGHPKTHDSNILLSKMRKTLEQNLQKVIGVSCPYFLISSYERMSFDFEMLEKQIIENFTQVKQEAMIFSICTFNETVLNKKVDILRKRTRYIALLSVPGHLTKGVDRAILTREITLYMDQLGLSPKSLRAAAHRFSIDLFSLQAIILKELPHLAKAAYFNGNVEKEKDAIDQLIQSQISIHRHSCVSNAAEILRNIPVIGGVVPFKANYAILNNILTTFHDVALKIINFYVDNAIKQKT